MHVKVTVKVCHYAKDDGHFDKMGLGPNFDVHDDNDVACKRSLSQCCRNDRNCQRQLNGFTFCCTNRQRCSLATIKKNIIGKSYFH